MDTKSIGVSNAGLHRANDLKNKAIDAEKAAENRDVHRNNPTFDVSLSQEAQELLKARQKATEIAKSTSPIREDRIAELKQRIAEGQYKIDSGKIADGMLVEAIKDEIASGTEV